MSIKLIQRAYLYLTIGHEGLGSTASSVQSDLFFLTKPLIEAASNKLLCEVALYNYKHLQRDYMRRFKCDQIFI